MFSYKQVTEIYLVSTEITKNVFMTKGINSSEQDKCQMDVLI